MNRNWLSATPTVHPGMSVSVLPQGGILMRKLCFSAGVFSVLLFAVAVQRLHGTMVFQNSMELRERAARLLSDGNFAEAFPLFRVLIEDSENGRRTAAGDLGNAVTCLQQLNRVNEFVV